jgi:hypothetical protein
MTSNRRVVALAAFAVAWGSLSVWWPSGASAARRVDLPTEQDILAVAVGAETILFGPKGIETLLPGPVEDEEVVTVGVGAGGVPVEVRVRQRLVLHGLGDFRFKVSGPAQTVEPLPDSEAEPGLRKGAVLWQGFSAERKVLSSTMALFPDQEAIRLPLQVAYEQTPAPGNGAASGHLAARVTIENRSATPVTITSARGDPGEVAGALDAIARRLARGKRPRPGQHGVPESLTAVGGRRDLTRAIPASFRVSGRLTFEDGTLDDPVVEGGRVGVRSGAPPVVSFGGVIGAGPRATMEVSLEGTARDLGRPVLEVVATPAPPPVEAVRAPGGGSWSAAVAQGRVDGTRAMWNRIMSVSWGIAKLRQYDAYMGNPDPTGPASTEYRYRLAAPAVDASPGGDGRAPVTVTPLFTISAALALLLLVVNGVLLWSLL